jgi:hypothetical protein
MITPVAKFPLFTLSLERMEKGLVTVGACAQLGELRNPHANAAISPSSLNLMTTSPTLTPTANKGSSAQKAIPGDLISQEVFFG